MAILSYTKQGIIGVAPEEVFDFCSDLRNELVWNPNAEMVEKLTDDPVGGGTRFRARWSNAGEVIVEIVEFDRPKSWATQSIARGMAILFRGSVAEQNEGTRYTARMELTPRGLAWLYAPLALLAMRRQDATNMRLIKETLESTNGPTADR